MSPYNARLLRASLVLVWLGTAVVSVLDGQRAGRALLHQSGLDSSVWISLLIWAGAAADMLVGALLWWKPSRPTYVLALGMLLMMTVVATWLLPALWLDPLAPLLKNLPIGAMLLVLIKTETRA